MEKPIFAQKYFCIGVFFLLLCSSLQLLHAQSQESGKSTIYETEETKGWVIQTKSAIYHIIIDEENEVKQVYFGPSPNNYNPRQKSTWIQNGSDEVPVRGGFPDKTPLLEVVFSDYVRDIDLHFVKGNIIEEQGRMTLKIVQRDTHYPLEVISYIRVLPEYDLLEKWIKVNHTGNQDPIKIENLKSASFALPGNSYELTHMAGGWGHEFQLRYTDLTPGIKTLESKNFKSVSTPPWFMVRPQEDTKSDTSGNAWFGTLAYSGNYRIDFDQAFNGPLQIAGGINFWDTHWMLKPGTHFQTPKFVVGFTQQGSEGVSHNLHSYIRESVLPEIHRNKIRPVLYNPWYATRFNINEENQYKLAQIARKIGVELFVIDDGWFKGRNNTKAGLGDWSVDKDKFPNGLEPLIQKINDMEMDFGLWVEPEMVNPDSDLYREHPEWTFHFPNRDNNQMRNQLMLNLAREDVYNYLLDNLTRLLEKYNISFLKWDFNRTLSEPGWPDAPTQMQREARIRYINNLYRLIDELKRRFPNIWIENCSSGGGRVDLGLLSRMDQVWTSDNTDPVDRLFIQYGYLNIFPANTMVSWTTDYDHHNIDPSLRYRFDVAMSGVLGIGNDIRQWTNKQMEIARKKINQYKRIREIVQKGQVYRLISPFETNRSALQYVSTDRNSSVLICYNMADYLKGSTSEVKANHIIRLRGLNPDQYYRIKQLDQTVLRGDHLMERGIPWPVDGAFQSQVLEIKRIVKE